MKISIVSLNKNLFNKNKIFMSKDVIIPVILCGGSGSRLWPLSRESFPKQYLSLIKDSKYSLLQNTIKRISNLKNITSPILICNEEHRFIVLDQLNQINIKPTAIILEPVGRNTAPAITISALKHCKIIKILNSSISCRS